MRIGAVLHPTVRLALADGASVLKHVNRPHPRIVRIAGFRSRVISMKMAPERRIVLSVIRSGC
jgi:hypothetical protein